MSTSRFITAAWVSVPVLAVVVLGCNAPKVQRDAEVQRFKSYLADQRQRLDIDPAKPLSMSQCEQLALANSLDLRVRDLSLRLQDSDVRLALADALPSGSLNYSDTRRSNRNLASLAPGQPAVEISDRHQQNLGIGAVLPVLDFGTTYYSWQIARDRRAQERLLLTRAEQLLRRDVRVAYARHAGAVRQERLSNTAFQAAQQVLRVARNLEREQMTAAADTALVEAALAEAALQLSLARQNVQQTKLNLAQLLSLGPGVEFSTDVSLPAVAAPPTEALVRQYEDQALLARPELAGQDLERHISANAVRKEAAAFFPKLDLIGSYNWTGGSGVVNPGFFTGGIQVTHSLLDGGKTIFRHQRAKQVVEVEAARSLLLSLGILYDVQLRALAVQQANDTVIAAAALEQARRAAFERILSMYREGLEDEAGAARSLADLTIQSTAMDRAQTEYQVAWYELEAATLRAMPPATQPTSQPAARPFTDPFASPATASSATVAPAATTKASQP